LESLEEELRDLKEWVGLVEEDKSLEKELEERYKKFEAKVSQQEFKVFLSGKYDKGNALLFIYAGAGGQDAQDWVAMLLRMYEKYCEKKGYKIKILHQSFGEGGGPEGRIGIKSVSLEIRGNYAYGFLKGESGVHRLVRISPFSAQSLRHTSFALVEVLPEILELKQEEIRVDPKDLKIETFRASGPGGQYVNRRESAVRITHLPTNIKVACQSERLQGLNREIAMKMLYAKLYQLRELERQRELKEIKSVRRRQVSPSSGDEQISAEWGNQIRSYVLHPYKMVKDLRTGIELSNVEAVLDGDLDEFINAALKLKAQNLKCEANA